jgi:hypothetical protein
MPVVFADFFLGLRSPVSAKEINHFRQDFEKAHADVDKPGISQDEFKEVCHASTEYHRHVWLLMLNPKHPSPKP